MTELRGLIARPDGSMARGRLSLTDRIVAIEEDARAGGDLILPGFVDLQVNGSHGLEVMTASAEGIAAIGSHLAREGTTVFLPATVTAPLDQIEQVHAAIGQAMDLQARERPAQQATIGGMHLEGPFVSGLRLGAHRAANVTPSGEALERVLKLKHLKLVTLAPELGGAIEAIKRFRSRDVAVSIGHSDASFEEATAAVKAGARMFTHVFNAMRPLHHRDPGLIAAALQPSQAAAAVIPDGVHVHPEIVKLVYRLRGAAGIVLTPDRVALSGRPPGSSMGAGAEQVRNEGGAARLGDGTLAGSVISMLDAIRFMVERVGAGVGEAALMAATNPAAVVELADRGRLSVKARADVVVLDRRLSLKAVFVGGRELS